MSDGEIKITSISDLLKLLHEKEIEVKDNEVLSFFLGNLEEGEETDLEAFTDSFSQNFGIENSEDVYDMLLEMSNNDGISGSISIEDIRAAWPEVTLISEEYSGTGWEDVLPEQDNFGNYIYVTANGSRVSVTNTDNMIVKQNASTGELVIIGANGGNVDVAKGGTVTVVESNIDEINAENGDETINVRGSHTNVGEISGGEGSQTVKIADGASVEYIDTGSDNDKITISGGSIVGKLKTGGGNDDITVEQSTVKSRLDSGSGNDRVNILPYSVIDGELDTGDGNDELYIYGSTINAKTSTGTGNDNITIKASNINGKITPESGTNQIEITDSHFGENANLNLWNNSTFNLRTTSNTVSIKNSQIDGRIDGQYDYDNLDLTIENSIVRDVQGVNNSGNTHFTTKDSAVGISGNYTRADREITPLDTSSQGEFAGFQKLTSSGLNSEGYYEYRLENGTVIQTKDNFGEIYFNPETGDIALNGINCQSVDMAGNSNLSVINSYIENIGSLSGGLNASNSIIGTIQALNLPSGSILNFDKCTITKINGSNSYFDITISNDSRIGSLNGYGDSGEVSINIESGSIDKVTTEKEIPLAITTSKDESAKVQIGTIKTDRGTITADLNNAAVTSITTKHGSINLKAKGGEIGTVTNNSSTGTTVIDFQDVTINMIDSMAQAKVKLNNCTIKELQTYQEADEISIKDSSAGAVVLGSEDNNKIRIQNSDIELVRSGGETIIESSHVDEVELWDGETAIKSSNVRSVDTRFSDNQDMASEHSIINGEYVSSDATGASSGGRAAEILAEINEEQTELLYEMLSEIVPEQIEAYGSSLTKEQIIAEIFNSDDSTVSKLKEQLILNMRGVLAAERGRLDDYATSMGVLGRAKTQEETEYQNKLEMLESAVESGDYKEILAAYSVIVGNKADISDLKDIIESIAYAETLSEEDMSDILTVLSFIGNALEYSAFSGDGVIKSGIAAINNGLDLGTTKNEVEAYLATYRETIKSLKAKLEQGELTPSEFAQAYKQLTGTNLTLENTQTLLDNVRGNDVFDNGIEEAIENYQNTQQMIFSTGEYIIIIAAGTCVTLATGGAAGTVAAHALRSLGRMGIALTATTVSYIAKSAIEITERSTNSSALDDVTLEELGRSAALMYAGCISGQFGNAVYNLVGSQFEEATMQLIAGKLAGLSADSLMCLAFDTAITGSSDFTREFLENLKQEFVGLIQSAITNAYFDAHKYKSAVQDMRYNASQQDPSSSATEINYTMLKKAGFSDAQAREYSSMSAAEVDTLILLAISQADGLISGDRARIQGDDALPQIKTENPEPVRTTDEEIVARLDDSEPIRTDEETQIRPEDAEPVRTESTDTTIKPISAEDTAAQKQVLLESLSSNRYIQSYPGIETLVRELIDNCETSEQLKIAEELLSNDEFYSKRKMDLETYSISYEFNSEKSQMRIKLLSMILSDENLYANDAILNYAKTIILEVENYNTGEGQIEFLKKVFSDERLYSNDDFMKEFDRMCSAIFTPEEAKNITDILQRILADENLSSNHEFIGTIPKILCYTFNQTEIQNKINILSKIYSDENIYGNLSSYDINRIVDSSKNTEDTQARIEMLETIMSDERLYTNEGFMEKLSDILYYTISDGLSVELEFLDTILSYKELYTNDDYMVKVAEIMTYLSTPKETQAAKSIIDKIFTNEALYKNANIVDYIYTIISKATAVEELVLKCEIFEEILSDERLYSNDELMYSICKSLNATNTPTDFLNKFELIKRIYAVDGITSDPELTKMANRLLENLNKASSDRIELFNTLLFDSELLNSPQNFLRLGNLLVTFDTVKPEYLESFIENKLYNIPTLMHSAPKLLTYYNPEDIPEVIALAKSGYNIRINELQQGQGTEIIAELSQFINNEASDDALTRELPNKIVMIQKTFDRTGKNVSTSRIEFECPEIIVGENGNWIINGRDTKIKAEDSTQPQLTVSNNYWEINGQNTAIRTSGILESSYQYSDRTIITQFGNSGNKIIAQYEIVNRTDGTPEYILVSRASDQLEGAIEITRYNLEDYPENMDVLAAIQDGSITGGHKLSDVTVDGNTTRYTEELTSGDVSTKRSYTETRNESGALESTSYRYDITGNDSDMSIERSWVRNSDNTTMTTVNGKTYTAAFDDATMSIEITDSTGKHRTISFAGKFLPETTPEDQARYFEFLKSVPADYLLIMGNKLTGIKVVDDLDSVMGYRGTLYSGTNEASLLHELGHLLDNGTTGTGKQSISQNPELIKIYTEEIAAFNKKFTSANQRTIRYFGLTGGSGGGTGLSEFIAEVNMLMNTYGNTNPEVQTRGQFLVEYFPNTLAKAVELLTSAKTAAEEEISYQDSGIRPAAITGGKNYSMGITDDTQSTRFETEINNAADRILRYAQNNDTEDEIDISAVREILTEIQGNRQNLNSKGLEAVEKLLYSLCDSSAEGEYINFEAILTGLKYIAEMTEITDDISYKLESLMSHSEDGGIFSVENIDLVKEFFTRTKTMLGGNDAKQVLDILTELDKAIGDSDSAEDNLSKLVDELENISRLFPEEEQGAVLFEHYINNVPLSEIEGTLNTNKNTTQLYDALAQRGINVPKETLTSRLGKTIDILLSRNYTIEDIAEKLSTQGVVYRLLENVKAVNPEIMADFIESNMETYAFDYDIFHEYTTSHWKFSDYTTDDSGEIIPGKEYSPSEAERLHTALQSVRTPRDMTVYRGEGFEILDTYYLPDGTRLSDAIREALTTNNPDLKTLIRYIMSDTTITQPRFMSTAYTQGGAEHFIKGSTGILWEIDVPEGSHGLYVDPFNSENSNEAEILFDRNSSMTIYGIEFRDNIIYLKARMN